MASTARKPPNAGKGRPKGVPNKTTGALKDAILEAAKLTGTAQDPKAPDGLVSYLRGLATTQPVAFASLLGKVLPLTVAGDGTSGGALVVTWQRDEAK